MGAAEVAPAGSVVVPALRIAAAELRLGLDAEPVPRQAGGLPMAAQRGNGGSGLLVRPAEGKPAFANRRAAFEERRGAAAEPNGDGRAWARQDAGLGHRVEAAAVGEAVRRPELAEQLHLFRLASPARRERHAERLVFHFVPAAADAEPKAVAGEDRQFRRLLRHQRGLALGQDEHAGGELDARGDRGHEREHRERFVKRHVLVVGATPAAGPVGIRAKHMVVDQHVLRPKRFRAFGVGLDGPGIGADFMVREYDAELHAVTSVVSEVGSERVERSLLRRA